MFTTHSKISLAILVLFALTAVQSVARQNSDPIPPKTEKVAYLGITSKPVDPALGAQLKLPEDTGLTVSNIDRKGPAARDLRINDVLQKLDDQILIDSHQLVTLIHMHQPGDTVTLTFIRETKSMQATIKLGEKERIVPNDSDRTAIGPVNPRDDDQSDQPFDPNNPLPRGNQTAMNFSDDVYSASVKADSQGRRHMTVKDLTGQVIATGPVDTEEEWQKFKPEIRQHLEMLHKMLGLKKK